jgi:hypothetical protein
MNLRKRHKSMGLVSNMLIHDENIVNIIDQQVSCSVWTCTHDLYALTQNKKK